LIDANSKVTVGVAGTCAAVGGCPGTSASRPKVTTSRENRCDVMRRIVGPAADVVKRLSVD
jgi:hypothetical protein